MKTIRNFGYAAVLALTTFILLPTLAAAEDAHGSFTLSHEVHLQNCVLRPGTYAFSLKNSGPQPLLTLRGLNGTGSDAMLLVSQVETARPAETSKLVLVSRDGQSFVSTMDLPGYDMTLRFRVPSQGASK